MSSTPSRNPKRSDAIRTRAALLAAATESFAQQGYEDSSMRQVCARADVNLGAVRHYFGSKEELYREVLITAHHQLMAEDPIPRLSPGDDPRDALRKWVYFLLRIFLVRRASHPHAGRLIAWELRDPTPAFDELITEILGPVRQALNEIVGSLLQEADTPERRARGASFVHGICVFHDQNRELLQRMGQPVPSTEEELIPFAEAVVAFAEAGIEGLRRDAKKSTTN